MGGPAPLGALDPRSAARVELLIVGAGPAGIAGALWARTLGLEARVIEQAARPGGQLQLIHFHPAELPGIPVGDGPAIAAVCEAQLRAAGMTPDCRVAADELELAPGRPPAVRAENERIEAEAVLVATGLRRRRLGVPGEAEFVDRGVSYSARLDRDRFAGDPVVVVGGGDGAFENALLLAEVGCRVTLLVRERPRARPEFRARVEADPHVRILEDAAVLELVGADRLAGVRFRRGGEISELPATAVVIKIGWIPNTEWCASLARDPEGYIVVDGEQRASHPRVWAAGDVARPLLPSISAAHGSATTALASIRRTLRGG